MKVIKNETYTIPQTLEGNKLAEQLIDALNGNFKGRKDCTVCITVRAKYWLDIEPRKEEE